MAIIFTANYKINQIGKQILLDIQLDSSGAPLSNNGFSIDSTGCSEIESSILSAGGGNLDEVDYIPGTAVLIPDGNYGARIPGYAIWNRINNTIDINFHISWSCTSSVKVTARFMLFSDTDPAF